MNEVQMNFNTMNDYKISVIICAYTTERLKDIQEAVDSALNQTLKPYEVIVSIDHNQDLSIILREVLPRSVKVILNKDEYGVSATRNVGIGASTGEIVAFIDDDSIAERTWLENLIPPLCNDRVMGVSGRVELIWFKRRSPFWFPEEFDFMFGGTAHKKLAMLPNGEIRNVNENNAAFRRDLFNIIGFMEAKLGRCYQDGVDFDAIGGEGAEFCLRMKAKHIRLSIGGMSCAGCVKAVEDALNGVPGVREVSVNFA